MHLGSRGTSDTVRIVVSDRSKDRNTGKSAGCSYPGNFPEQLCDLRSCSRKRQKSAGGKKKIGIVTQLSGSSFMLEVKRGIQTGKKELEELGEHEDTV